MNKLRQYIREMVETELAEMARISTNIKAGDSKRVASAKMLYKGTWIEDLLNIVIDSGETGIPQPVLAAKLGYKGMQSINPIVRKFLESGTLTKGELSVPKQEKPTSSGQLGRPTSEKTLVAKALVSKMEADPNYEPSEKEMELLGPEFIENLRRRVMGVLKRGRPLGKSRSSDGMLDTLKSMMDSEDTDGDGDVDDDDLDTIKEFKSLNESYNRMQKLAGLNKK